VSALRKTWLATWAALGAVGCEAVPALYFETDASVDARAPADATNEATKDATAIEAGDSGTAAISCPASPPDGGTCCSGTNPCRGDCGTAGCAACVNKCGPAQLCCVKANAPNPHCITLPSSQACP
jgi:hypothetical protein